MNDILYSNMSKQNPVRLINSKFDASLIFDPIRVRHADIVIAVAKLLKGSDQDKLPFLNLLFHSYYCWLPDYFFITPASSTGKYHPEFANKSNGLMLHSLAVSRYTAMMCDFIKDLETHVYNTLICAAWLHDMFKYGDPTIYKPGVFVDHGHAKYAADFFNNSDIIQDCNKLGLLSDDIVLLSHVIATHMGPFTTSKYSDIVLSEPETPLQKLIYTADYFASRKENDIIRDLIT